MPEDQAHSARSSSDYSLKSLLDTFSPQIDRWKSKVRQYACRSAADRLYSGSHLQRLSDFLQRDEGEFESNANIKYAVLYDFAKAKPRIDLRNPSDLGRVVEANMGSQGQSQLLLLRGYPSAAWLSAVGAVFDVDPEFFDQHLRIQCSQGARTASKWPFPSPSAVTEPRLRFTTSGFSQEMNERSRKASHVEGLRKGAKDIFSKYVRELSNGKARTGDSVLRGISIHDSVNFSFEQDVSIWTKQTDRGWTAIAWLDFGCHNLADGRLGDSFLIPVAHNHADSNVFRPVVLGRLRDVLEYPHATDQEPLRPDENGERNPKINQNVLNLWYQYDCGLDLDLARLDAFYALSRLFKLASACERQFLHLIQQLVADEVEQAGNFKEDDAYVSNLQDHQQVLSRHKKLLRRNVAAIHKHSAWPRHAALSEIDSSRISQVAQELEDEFQDLLTDVEDTAKECSQGVNDLTNAANLMEAQRAIAQAEGVARLTRLASVFIPLALLAAFFGMNFHEFGQGTLHLWVFIAAAVPTFAISIFCLVPGPRDAAVAFWRLCLRGRNRPRDGVVELDQLV
ncbi:hypothetical protein PRZ48_010328 [Zasmidium cellare]|uniref:Uncharacterized protein n=1 Tax=Zasmidium cellare TaxID=395010 RepID=A0ABR0E8B6_ZASCE|nr:hypothetical protein PRZ48_010328 [Zasmidium cellare]